MNATLLSRFYEEASAESNVLMVYIPTDGAGDFSEAGVENNAHLVLGRAALPYLDLTDCLSAVPPAQRRIPGGSHYSALANLAIAQCVAGGISSAIGYDGR